MDVQRTAQPDKTIVDRRKSVRNADLRRTLDLTRSRLTTGGTLEPGLTMEMLIKHAEALATSMAALPMLVAVATVFGFFIGYKLEALAWAVAATAIYWIIATVAKSLLKTPVKERAKLDVARKEWIFVGLHALAGLAWLGFVLLPCQECEPTTSSTYTAMVLLIAMAATSIICFGLRWAVLATFSAPVLAYAGAFILSDNVERQMLSAMLLVSLMFFAFIGERLKIASTNSMRAQTQNDSLVAELEMARSISEEARRRAEEANLAKSRFLASMSHELRTPLNAILGFSEVMSNEVLGPIGNDSYKGYVDDILGSGQHLLNLINEILDLSRIEAGKYDMRNEAVRLAEIAADCTSLLRVKAAQKTVSIENNFDENLPQLLGDERAIRQIILNLLSNAVKFTPQNGTITVKVGFTAAGGQYVSVSDTGPGIPEEEIPVVLSAFGQGSIAIKSAEQGTGLGLPIVQALIAMHEGKFKLTSKLRQGTQAMALFPAKRSLHAMPPQAEPGSAARGAGDRNTRQRQVA